jgi:hypothetical protein
MQDFIVHARDRRAGRRMVRLGCEVVRTSDYKLVGDRAIDVSDNGLQLLQKPWEKDVELGEDVQVFFRVPFSGIWVLAEGKVQRVVRGTRRGDEGRAYGIQMADLHEEAASALRHAMGRFPPTLPRRSKRIDYAATVRLISRT